MLNTLLSQLVKNVKTLPGWAPLLLILYVASYFVDIEIISDANTEKLFKNTVVIIVAFLSYQLGDAIDKAFYNIFERDRIKENKRLVRERLDIKNGIYRVMKAFAIAQGEYNGSWIQVLNESAKLIRSLAVVFLAIGITAIIINRLFWGVGLIIFGIFALYVAFFLKFQHKARLYGLVERTVVSIEYKSETLSSGVRLFFWDGELVGSAMSAATLHNTLQPTPETGRIPGTNT